MPWLLLDLALALIALVVLAACGLTLWRAVKALGRQLGDAGEAVAARTDELARLQAEGAARELPPVPEPVLPAPARAPGRRRPTGSTALPRVR